jgi:D-alanyl-D-alanine dipeptidase
LTPQAAASLQKVQTDLVKKAMSLKIYDCYRPQMAVDNFVFQLSKPILQALSLPKNAALRRRVVTAPLGIVTNMAATVAKADRRGAARSRWLCEAGSLI